MRGQLGFGGNNMARVSRLLVLVDDGGEHRRTLGGEQEPVLPTAGQLNVDIGEQLAVKQRVVRGASAEVDVETAAERVEAVGKPGELGFREGERVDHSPWIKT